MTLYEVLGIGMFLGLLLTRPALRADSMRNPIGTCMVAMLWPAAVVAMGYYLVKVRVFGKRALGRPWVMDVEIMGFLIAMLFFVLACAPVLQRHVF